VRVQAVHVNQYAHAQIITLSLYQGFSIANARVLLEHGSVCVTLVSSGGAQRDR